MKTGSILGIFEVLAPLGEGGMGKVYRARDTRLKREVALKVLPDEMADDASLLARFDREATVLASLNHPNIATIYGREEHEGTPLLVLELVEGETLADKLSGGPLPVSGAMEFARQLAEALEAAHEKGIIHRDLKPSNVMVTPRNTIKVLDFGIAKPLDLEESGTTELTATGMLLGTVPYMSPEQVRGQPLDERADIWSFGCLLLEMFTGERTFDRDTIADTLAAIVEHEPKWDRLPAETPPAMRILLNSTLEKDAKQRLADVKDARRTIEETLADPTAVSSVAPTTAGDAVLERARQAYDRYAWQETFDLLEPISSTLSAEDMFRFARAAWWTGHLGEAIEADEKAYALYVDEGNRLKAAATAIHVADHYGRRLEVSLASGWLARAERLLEGEPVAPVHGWLLRPRIQVADAEGRVDDALELAAQMLEIGTNLGDRDLQAVAIHYQGRGLIKQGKIQQGMALLDEATVAAISGELSPSATAVIYCNAISASRSLADYRRASEWTSAAKRWCERQSIAGFPGICRVFRAEVMRLHGEWVAAEEEARRACTELESFAPSVVRVALHELGEIRLRMGDHAAAEDAFRQARQLGRDPQPGLALLQLAQGDVGLAAGSIKRALESGTPDPLARSRLLPAQVEIALAAKDLDTARVACEELESISNDFGAPALRAAAEHARGALKLAEDDLAAAARHLGAAFHLWEEAHVPYESARARELRGLVYLAEGDVPGAQIELQAACSTFVELGAVPDSRRAAGVLTEKTGQRPDKRETLQ